MGSRQVGGVVMAGHPAMPLPPAGSRRRVTPFQHQVYDVVSVIPRGRVSTYGGVARAIGCRSCRAVGQALRHNPFAPRVPCHRVIASDLTLGGFNGHRGGAEAERKRRLLAGEGVCFDAAGRLSEPRRVWEQHNGSGAGVQEKRNRKPWRRT